jgi:hypothetical protein
MKNAISAVILALMLLSCMILASFAWRAFIDRRWAEYIGFSLAIMLFCFLTWAAASLWMSK